MSTFRVAIMYGSQTGNAQSIAEGVHQECKARSLDSTLLTCNGWKKMQPELKDWGAVVLVIATTGNGDPTENADRFWRFLKKRANAKDMLAGLPFTVLGLGDTNYDKFCYMGKNMDTRLRELGAVPFHEAAFADEATGMEKTVEPWLEGLYSALESLRLSLAQGLGRGEIAGKDEEHQQHQGIPEEASTHFEGQGAGAVSAQVTSARVATVTSEPRVANGTPAVPAITERGGGGESCDISQQKSIFANATDAGAEQHRQSEQSDGQGGHPEHRASNADQVLDATDTTDIIVSAAGEATSLVGGPDNATKGQALEPSFSSSSPKGRVAVLYGSQTGNAQSIAEGLHQGCQLRGLESTLQPCNGWKKMTPPLKDWDAVVIVVATTGNGDPTENSDRFWRFLKRRTNAKDMLAGLPFTVLGLGDTNYDKFCYMGKNMDTRMRELGAVPFHEAAFADEATGMEKTVEPWLEGLYTALATQLSKTNTNTCSGSIATSDNPIDRLNKTRATGMIPTPGRVGKDVEKDPNPNPKTHPSEAEHQENRHQDKDANSSSSRKGAEGSAIPDVAMPKSTVRSAPSAESGQSTTGVLGALSISEDRVRANQPTSASAHAPTGRLTTNTPLLSGIGTPNQGVQGVGGETWLPSSESGVLPLSAFLQGDHLRPDFTPKTGDVPRARAPASDVQFQPPSGGARVRDRNEGDQGGVMSNSYPTLQAQRRSASELSHSADNPCHAKVLCAKYLTKGGKGAERRVILAELGLQGSGITYEPGDVIGIQCKNNSQWVDFILDRLQGGLPEGADPDTPFQHHVRSLPSPCTLREALSMRLDLQATLRRPAIRTLAEACKDVEEKRLMKLLCAKTAGAALYQDFVSRQGLTLPELLEFFPSCKPRAGTLLALLPPLPPRFYSVASSQLVCKDRVAIAFSVVRYRLPSSQRANPVTRGNSMFDTNPVTRGNSMFDSTEQGHSEENASGPIRFGLCTNWLERILGPMLDGTEGVGDKATVTVPVFMKPTKEFLLPGSAKWPCVLIGPGTGVSPFIGFLHHREQQMVQKKEAKDSVCSGFWRGGYEIALEGEEGQAFYSHSQGQGDMLLFFGCRDSESDWIFRTEMEGFLDRGVLSKLITAFSREQEDKVYVQDRIIEAGEDLCHLMLDRGAYFYVCGDGNAMAQGVHKALSAVLSKCRGLTNQQAEDVLKEMKDRKRYVLDVWS